jgi:hypothetical protein
MTYPLLPSPHEPPAAAGLHLIHDASRLDAVAARRAGPGTFRLAGVLASHPRRRAWEDGLNQHYRACGCDTGARGLLGGLACGALACCGAYVQGGGVASLLYVPGLGLAGALLGKITGLIGARVRLGRIIHEIRAELQSPRYAGPSRGR